MSLPFSSWISPSSPCLQELAQVIRRSNAEHKLAARICDDGKLLLPASIHPALEELLQLLERRLHVDDLVASSPSLELVHGCLDRVVLVHFALLEQLLQARDADVSEQSAVLGRHDCQVGVVALEAAHQSPGDGVLGRDRERGWWVEVFYRCL